MAEREISGQVIVITGASSGFGKGVARVLAKAGAQVALAARREELLEELAAECERLGGRAVAVPADVSNENDVKHLASTAESAFGHIDVWINNAGVGAIGRFEDIPLPDHVKVLTTNLLGTLFGSWEAMRRFRAQGHGTLINVASVVGKVPAPYYASYAASKHGVVGLSAAIRQELLAQDLDDAIHVCTVMPTSMDTPFFDHAANYSGHQVQPLPPLYDEQKVVEAIVRLVRRPKDEVAVGSAGLVMIGAHHVARGLTERLQARQTHRIQMQKAPPAPDSAGSVREPQLEGAGVSGGRKN